MPRESERYVLSEPIRDRGFHFIRDIPGLKACEYPKMTYHDPRGSGPGDARAECKKGERKGFVPAFLSG